jgi:hypothetical protein
MAEDEHRYDFWLSSVFILPGSVFIGGIPHQAPEPREQERFLRHPMRPHSVGLANPSSGARAGTEYCGYRFRSRLEARWEVFLDALGLEWEYEE